MTNLLEHSVVSQAQHENSYTGAYFILPLKV